MGNSFFKEKNIYIIISKKEIKDRDLCKIIFEDINEVYFIDNSKLKNFPYSYFTPKDMINYTLKKKKEERSFADILELLEINDYIERFERPWRYQGNNKWICSAALGIAEGRKYFCLPWMYTSVMDYQEYRNNQIFQAIKKIGGNIIFPVEGLNKIRFIHEEDICIKNIDEIL